MFLEKLIVHTVYIHFFFVKEFTKKGLRLFSDNEVDPTEQSYKVFFHEKRKDCTKEVSNWHSFIRMRTCKGRYVIYEKIQSTDYIHASTKSDISNEDSRNSPNSTYIKKTKVKPR